MALAWSAWTGKDGAALEARRVPRNIMGMDPHPRPPVLDMTPEGEFRDAAPPPLSGFDRTLARIGGVATLVALTAGGLLLASLAVLFVGLVLPVLIIAGAIGGGSLWWRMRRARRQGQAAFVVIRR